MTDIENFLTPWPAVLVEMKDYIDLCFLARGRPPAAITVFISKALVKKAELQPHVREFRTSLAANPSCKVQLKGTEQAAHRVEIEYRR